MITHCALCGLDFDPSCTEMSCQGCPLNRSCRQITCPRCGYLILPEATLLRWLRKFGEFLQSKKSIFKERT